MRGAWVVLAKELAEMRRSPLLLMSMVSLPTTTVVVPVVLSAWLARVAPHDAALVIEEIYGLKGQGAEVIARAIGQNWLPVFLVLPVFIPILVAAQSIGGERERRTLEPLLATPVSTLEIVLGKSLAAVVPALGLTWAAALVFVLAIDLLAGYALLPNGPWLVAVLLLSPLMALFGNALAVAVSARVADPRAAQNLAAMTVVPLIGLMVAQLIGKVNLGMGFYLGLAAAFLVIDAALVVIAARLFDRERLLARWR